MSYKCKECGHIFEEGEQAVWREKVGEYGSEPCYETLSGCPKCHSDYEKTIPCVICGSEHLSEEMIENVCEECFDKYSVDVDACYKMANGEKSTISINMFLAEIFGAATIEEILLDFLKDNKSYIEQNKSKFKKFAYDEKEWFAERLTEVIKNEK